MRRTLRLTIENLSTSGRCLELDGSIVAQPLVTATHSSDPKDPGVASRKVSTAAGRSGEALAQRHERCPWSRSTRLASLSRRADRMSQETSMWPASVFREGTFVHESHGRSRV